MQTGHRYPCGEFSAVENVLGPELELLTPQRSDDCLDFHPPVVVRHFLQLWLSIENF